MRKLPHELFVAGFQLPGAIRDARGRVLLPAGITLSDDHLRVLGQRSLFGGDDWPVTATAAPGSASGAPDSDGTGKASASGVRFTLRKGPANRANTTEGAIGPAQPALMASIAQTSTQSSRTAAAGGEIPDGALALSSLRVGTTTTRDLYSPSGVLLLAAGTQITARFVELIEAHGVRWVQFSPTPAAAGPAPRRGRDGRLTLESLAAEVRTGLDNHARAAGHLRGVCQELATGRSPSGNALTESVRGFLDQLTLDRDILALIVSAQRTPGGEYLFDHCLNTSLTSLSIAAQLGLPSGETFQLGLAALLHDIGMLHVPDPIRLAARPVTPAELAEIRRHPIVSSGRIERITHLPEDVAAVAGQVHEREDGSGYPRGRTGGAIHPLAKIVAVADSFCAMTRARPHRPSMARHEAVRTLLGEGHAGRLDRGALRGLLDAVSAFPIGCVVELADTRRAQVMRPNKGAHTRPIVRVLGADGAPTDELIDLAADRDLTVAAVTDGGAEPALARV